MSSVTKVAANRRAQMDEVPYVHDLRFRRVLDRNAVIFEAGHDRANDDFVLAEVLPAVRQQRLTIGGAALGLQRAGESLALHGTPTRPEEHLRSGAHECVLAALKEKRRALGEVLCHARDD